MKFVAISDVGRVRPGNEDMILVDGCYVRDGAASGECRRFAIVADGMGGNAGGELASDIACQEFESWYESLEEPLNESVNRFVSETHALINLRGEKLPGFQGMGTTFVGVFYFDSRWWWVNIGDSRLYLLRSGNLSQISTDHSMRNLTGDMSQPSNLIYNCLGSGDGFTPFADFGPLDCLPGDRLLLCSDGLSDMLTDEEIAVNFATGTLVEKANHAGGHDNISIIILENHV